MKILRLILAGTAFAIIGQAIHVIEAFATMQYYMLPEYWPVWSKIMMPGPGPPGTEFYAVSIVLGIVTGTLAAFVYGKVKPALPGKNALNRGFYYGLMLFMVAGLPTTFTMFLLFNVPAGLVAAWTASGLAVHMLGSAAIAKIMG